MRSLPQVYTDLNAIPDVLQALRETAPPGTGVLSVYLDTSVHRIKGQAYRLAFREPGRTIRSDLETAPRPEQKAFEEAAERATQYLANEFVPSNPGLALFASADPDYFFAVPLPQQPADIVTWSPEPQLASLEGRTRRIRAYRGGVDRQAECPPVHRLPRRNPGGAHV